MAEFWIGDTHFGHERVSKLRGFKTTQEHDNVIIEQISVLNPGDRLWVLGDISGGRRDEENYAIEIFKKLREELEIETHLIAGNHDSVSSIHRNGFKQQDRFREGFDSIQVQGRFNMYRESIIMSHYPYAASGDGDGRDTVRYLEWRIQDTGKPLMHAHTHQNHPFSLANIENVTRIERDGLEYNSMCVSWEARRGLTTEVDVTNWIKTRSEILKKDKAVKINDFYSKILNAPR